MGCQEKIYDKDNKNESHTLDWTKNWCPSEKFITVSRLVGGCATFILISLVTTGSQKKDDVTTLKKLGIFEPSAFKYSILNPTNPCGTNLF